MLRGNLGFFCDSLSHYEFGKGMKRGRNDRGGRVDAAFGKIFFDDPENVKGPLQSF